jgi:hypothetical protein
VQQPLLCAVAGGPPASSGHSSGAPPCATSPKRIGAGQLLRPARPKARRAARCTARKKTGIHGKNPSPGATRKSGLMPNFATAGAAPLCETSFPRSADARGGPLLGPVAPGASRNVFKESSSGHLSAGPGPNCDPGKWGRRADDIAHNDQGFALAVT